MELSLFRTFAFLKIAVFACRFGLLSSFNTSFGSWFNMFLLMKFCTELSYKVLQGCFSRKKNLVFFAEFSTFDIFRDLALFHVTRQIWYTVTHISCDTELPHKILQGCFLETFGISINFVQVFDFENLSLTSPHIMRTSVHDLTHFCPPLRFRNQFLPTVPTFAVQETDVSRHNGGTSGAPLNPSETIVLWEHYRLWGV